MRLRRALVLALIAALPVLAPARTLRYASQDDPQTLDPHSANLLATSRLLGNVYEPLVWRDRDWKVIPWLAAFGERQPEVLERMRARLARLP